MSAHLVEEELARYLDGRLSAAERRAVEAHLAECDECLHAVGETWHILHDDRPVPADLPTPPPPRLRPVIFRPFFQAAAAALVALLAVFVWWSGRDSGHSARQVAYTGAPVPPPPVTARAPSRDKEAAPVSAGKAKADEALAKTAPPPAPAAPVVTAPLDAVAPQEREGRALAAAGSTAPSAAREEKVEAGLGATAAGEESKVVSEVDGKKAKAAPPPTQQNRPALQKGVMPQMQFLRSLERITLQGDALVADVRNPEVLVELQGAAAPLRFVLQVDRDGRVQEGVEWQIGPEEPLRAALERIARRLLFTAAATERRRVVVAVDR